MGKYLPSCTLSRSRWQWIVLGDTVLLCFIKQAFILFSEQNNYVDLSYRFLFKSTTFFCCIFFLWRCDPTRVMASSFLRFLDHTQRRTTVGRTSLDEWSARRRYLYLTIHNTHNRQTSMPPVGFEPTISAGERPQIYALELRLVPMKYECSFLS